MHDFNHYLPTATYRYYQDLLATANSDHHDPTTSNNNNGVDIDRLPGSKGEPLDKDILRRVKVTRARARDKARTRDGEIGLGYGYIFSMI